MNIRNMYIYICTHTYSYNAVRTFAVKTVCYDYMLQQTLCKSKFDGCFHCSQGNISAFSWLQMTRKTSKTQTT